MQDFTGIRSVPVGAFAAVVLTVILAACSGGVRPTLTGDPIPQAASEPSVAAQLPPPTAVELTAPTAVPEPSTDDVVGSPIPDAIPGELEQFTVEIIESFPHDENAFTQGLELHDGVFFESAGPRDVNNQTILSTLRRVDPATGEVQQSISIAQQYWAEGLTKVDDQLIQLTWRENTAFFYDAETFEVRKEVSYPGEGWGLCYDGNQLVMTDGTPVLIFRDPTTFAETGRVPVSLQGQEVWNLNEAECVNGSIWANVWLTDLIVRIDPATGEVTGVVDASNLPKPDIDGATLNGIAWDTSTQSFYVTGKLWPTMYRVNFVPTTSS